MWYKIPLFSVTNMEPSGNQAIPQGIGIRYGFKSVVDDFLLKRHHLDWAVHDNYKQKKK
jgi:hypothetical protein